jgi:hypothetical protein
MRTLAIFASIVFAHGYATASNQLTDGRVNALAVADVLTAKCQSIYPSTAIYIPESVIPILAPGLSN